MQLDHVDVSFEGIFEAGQAYVALSRVRTLEGLYLHDFQPQRVRAHPAALEFYATSDRAPHRPDEPPTIPPAILDCWRETLPPALVRRFGL